VSHNESNSISNTKTKIKQHSSNFKDRLQNPTTELQLFIKLRYQMHRPAARNAVVIDFSFEPE
jgi:hypothetical protein